jgi:hypothetical protein
LDAWKTFTILIELSSCSRNDAASPSDLDIREDALEDTKPDETKLRNRHTRQHM